MASDEEVHRILDENSTEKYYIEYSGFLSNHLAHGVLALQTLGADKQRIKRYVQWYIRRLEDPARFADENDPNKVKDSIDEMQGERKSYYLILKHYEDLLVETYHNSIDELLAGEFPKVGDGMLGSALHALIHTGYGYAARHRRTVLEGLAYLHHSFWSLQISEPSALTKPLGEPGDMDILDVIHMVKKDDKLYREMLRHASNPVGPARPGLQTGFQLRARVLFTLLGEELVGYANRIRLPLLPGGLCTADRCQHIMKFIVDSTVVAYVMCERRNQFFLLHAVTSAWSLMKILSVVKDPDTITKFIRTFLCIFLAAYLAEGRIQVKLRAQPGKSSLPEP